MIYIKDFHRFLVALHFKLPSVFLYLYFGRIKLSKVVPYSMLEADIGFLAVSPQVT